MSNYRRYWLSGGTWFFTVTLLGRHGVPFLTRYIDALRTAVSRTRADHPFVIHAWVVLPEHLHCIIELPEGDADFSLRWRLIKSRFSMAIPRSQWRSEARARRGERAVWQRRFWDHKIRDQEDLNAHMNYIHFNPLKHGLVTDVKDWPYSTFHRFVQQGVYPNSWNAQDAPLADRDD
jgi:putative transposase